MLLPFILRCWEWLLHTVVLLCWKEQPHIILPKYLLTRVCAVHAAGICSRTRHIWKTEWHISCVQSRYKRHTMNYHDLGVGKEEATRKHFFIGMSITWSSTIFSYCSYVFRRRVIRLFTFSGKHIYSPPPAITFQDLVGETRINPRFDSLRILLLNFFFLLASFSKHFDAISQSVYSGEEVHIIHTWQKYFHMQKPKKNVTRERILPPVCVAFGVLFTLSNVACLFYFDTLHKGYEQTGWRLSLCKVSSAIFFYNCLSNSMSRMARVGVMVWN